MEVLSIDLPYRPTPLVPTWQGSGYSGGPRTFVDARSWRDAVARLSLEGPAPEVVRSRHARASKRYLLGWIDFDSTKGAELVALKALGVAVADTYRAAFPTKRRTFSTFHRHMVDPNGLADASLPTIALCGGAAVDQLTGNSKPTLSDRRNAAAHGDPFDGSPVGDLVESVRDPITDAYRDMPVETAGHVSR